MLIIPILNHEYTIVTGSRDGTIKLYKNPLYTNKFIHTSEYHNFHVRSLFLIPNTFDFISESWDDDILVWSGISAQCLKRIEGHYCRINCPLLVIPKTQQLIASSCGKNIVETWDLLNKRNKECLKVYKVGKSPVTSLLLIPETSELIMGLLHGQIQIWSLLTDECLKVVTAHDYSIEFLLRGNPWCIIFVISIFGFYFSSKG